MDKCYSKCFKGVCPQTNKDEQICINFVEFPNSHIVGNKALGFKCLVHNKCLNPNECPIFLKYK